MNRLTLPVIMPSVLQAFRSLFVSALSFGRFFLLGMIARKEISQTKQIFSNLQVNFHSFGHFLLFHLLRLKFLHYLLIRKIFLIQAQNVDFKQLCSGLSHLFVNISYQSFCLSDVELYVEKSYRRGVSSIKKRKFSDSKMHR